MAEIDFPYQPGVMLHAAIVGALHARGISFSAWSKARGLYENQVRQATYGTAKGPKGRALLASVIEAAGPDVVRAGYMANLERHLDDVRRAQKGGR